MSERLKELEQIAEQTRVADTSKDGVDHPVIQSYYEMLFYVAGRIQPNSPSYETAQRILDVIERGELPDEIKVDDLQSVFMLLAGHLKEL